MDCTLAALLACFSWSGLYLDASLAAQDNRVEAYHTTFVDGGGRYDFPYTHSSNPYARLELGYELNFRSATVFAAAFHNSSIETGRDKGVNGITLGVRWWPFRN